MLSTNKWKFSPEKYKSNTYEAANIMLKQSNSLGMNRIDKNNTLDNKLRSRLELRVESCTLNLFYGSFINLKCINKNL